MNQQTPPAADDEPAGAPTGTGVQYVEVAVDDAGQRLDNFLVRFLKDVPRTHVFRLLRKGEVRVNKKRAKPDQRVVVGDQVRIPPLRRAEAMPAPTEPRPASASLQKVVLDAIIYEDNDLIVFNKPSGIAVHGGSATDFGLIEALRSARPELVDAELVHRLDRDTSGCLLVAKRRGALRDLHLQLREGRTEKRYLALLCGKWNLGTKRIEVALDTNERRSGERHVAVRSHGKKDREHVQARAIFRQRRKPHGSRDRHRQDAPDSRACRTRRTSGRGRR